MTFKLMAKHQRTPYCTWLLEDRSGGKVYSSVAVLCNSPCGMIAKSSCQQHLPTTTKSNRFVGSKFGNISCHHECIGKSRLLTSASRNILQEGEGVMVSSDFVCMGSWSGTPSRRKNLVFQQEGRKP